MIGSWGNSHGGFLSADGKKGVTTYTQCDDDVGVFTMDSIKTKNSPNPVTKGSTLEFTLAGIVSDAMEVKNLHVHVLINKLPLWNEDHKQVKTYSDTYQDNFSWKVPSYAPSGHYDVTFTGTGNVADAGVTDGTVLCVNVQMDL